ncbi:MAG: acyl-CoA dehydrogenase family protein [Pseudonocardiaceae bacterium]
MTIYQQALSVRAALPFPPVGAPLGELGPVQLKLGPMQSRLMTTRLAVYHAVHLLDRRLPCDAELMNAKLVNVEYALDSAREAMEIHAASGLFTAAPSSAICATPTTFRPRRHLRHPATATR